MRHRARAAAPALAVLGLAAAVVVGVWQGYRWLVHSPRFAVADVVVVGNARASSSALLESAGVTSGANIFSLAPDKIGRAVERHPWVKRAAVSRQLPNRLLISVVERKPAAVAILGDPYLVDVDGVVFKRANLGSDEVDDLPIITGIPRELFTTHPEMAHTLRAVLDLVGRWHTDTSRPRVSEAHLSANGITLFTREASIVSGTLEGSRPPRDGLGRASLGSRPRETDVSVKVLLGRVSDGEIDERLARFDTVWATLNADERARAHTIVLDSPANVDRVVVGLNDQGTTTAALSASGGSPR